MTTITSGPTGTDGSDLIFAGGGNDSINSGAGNDIIFSGGGNDTINAGAGNDIVFAGSGNDTIDGGSGRDIIFAGAGNDTIDGGLGSDTIDAGAGNDTLIYTYANEARVVDYYNGGSGSDTLVLDFSKYTQWTQASWSSFEATLAQRIAQFKAMVDQYKAANGNLPNSGSKDFVFDFGNGAKLQVAMTEKVVVIAPVLTTLNHAPVITSGPQADAVQEDGTLVVGGMVTATDANTGDVLTYSGNATGVYGSFSVAANGKWTYTLDNRSNGTASKVQSLGEGEIQTETFTVTVSDGKGGSATQNVTITITGTNDAPVITSDVQAGEAKEDGTLVVRGTVTATDIDIDNAALTYSGDATGVYGSFTVDANGVWTYTLDNGTNGTVSKVQSLAEGEIQTETFTVTVSDGKGGTATQDVTITITGTNDAPFVRGTVSNSADEDAKPVPLDALAGASDVDNDTKLQVINVPQTLPAGVTYDADTHMFTLDPGHPEYQTLGEGVKTTVVVNYGISDGRATTSNSVQWVVTGTNDAPQVVRAVTGSATEDGAVSTLDAFVNIEDVDTDDVLTVVFSAGDTPSDPATAVVMPAGLEGQTTTVSDASPTPSDPTTGLTPVGAGGDPNVIAFDPQNPPPGITYDEATHSFSLNPSDKAFQSLGEGETRTVTISYIVSDGKTTIPATLQWVVTGTNDVPQVVSAVTGSATEDSAVSRLHAFVNIKDLDARDVLTVAFGAGGSDPNVIAFNPDQPPPGVSYDPGTQTFSLDPSHSAFQNLGEGETRTVTISYSVSDARATIPVTLQWVVTGTNDAPKVVSAVTGSATEDGAVSTLDAFVNIKDADTGDELTVVFSAGDMPSDPAAAVAMPAELGGQTTTLNDASPTPSDLTTGLTPGGAGSDPNVIAFDPKNPPPGITYDEATHSFSLNPSDKEFQSLGEGETRTVTISYFVSDGKTTIPATLQWVVTGTNDVPFVVARAEDSASANLTEGVGALTQSGTLFVVDHDTKDVVGAKVIGVTKLTDYTGTMPSLDTLLGFLTVSSADSSTTTGEAITWAFDPMTEKFRFLSAGQKLTLTYTVEVTDNNSAPVKQDVTITITGTNTAAELEPQAKKLSETDVLLTTSGKLTIADVDSPETFVAQTDTAGKWGRFSINEQGEWTYTTNSAMNELNDLEATAERFEVQSADGTRTYVNITIRGTNDAPTLAVTTPAAIPELADASAQDIAPVKGTLALTDLDMGNTLQVSLVGDPVLAFSGGSLTTAQTSALTTALATSKLALGSATPSNGGTVNVGYTWDPAAAALDFLANGQTLTVTYAVQVGDGTATSVTRNLAFTITGTNDAPTLSFAQPTAINELAGASAQDISPVTGVLTVTDFDSTRVQVSVLGSPVLSLSGGLLTSSQVAELTTALAARKLQVSGMANGAYTVGYIWDPSAASLDFLSAGQQLTVTYALQASDFLSTSPTQSLVFTINGTSETSTTPVFTAANWTPGTALPGVGETIGTVTLTNPGSGALTWTVTGTEVTNGIQTSVTGFSINSAGALSSSSGLLTASTYTLTLTATDPSSASNSSIATTLVIRTGTLAPDTLNGGTGDDLIYALGNPTQELIYGGPGNDTIFGQAGYDYIDAKDGNDVLYSGDGDGSLFGGAGNDTLVGGAGYDALFGDAGDDTLIGGLGSDSFIYDYKVPLADIGANRIEDFYVGQDSITLFDEVFTALGNPIGVNTMDSFQFTRTVSTDVSGKELVGDAFRIVAKTLGNGLVGVYYDANGGYLDDSVELAVVQFAPGSSTLLTYQDFYVI